jgi:glycosyltransferase involved in cell wall biosynthesis
LNDKENINSANIKIGVFGSGSFNKNIYNQVAGALMVENSIVFVSDRFINEVFKNDRIIFIGNNLEKEEFLLYLSNMDINLHCSFSESWGQIATESIMFGIPCLVSSNTNIFSRDIELYNDLVVFESDSPTKIKDKILLNLNKFPKERYKFYLSELNTYSIEKRNNFIN